MLDRIKLLENNIKELAELKTRFIMEDICHDKLGEWALRYGFLETIQIAIDISCHIVAKYNLGNPTTYTECIDLLRKYNYIDKSLTSKLIGMIGLRNILVHEYVSVDIERLYDLLNNVEDFKEFVNQIKEFV